MNDLEIRKGWHKHTNGGGWVEDTAKIDLSVYVGPNAQVSGNAWVFTPLFIAGSKQGVSHAALGVIQIGCEPHPIEWWLANADSIGKEHGYNEHEIAEYKQYLNLIAWRDAQIKKLNLVPATSRIDKAA